MNRRSGPNGRRSGAAGFTLIEVLLAFVVFALSFTVVLEILSGSMRNTARAKEYTEVALIAQSLMDRVGLDIPLLPGTTSNGEFGAYQWELDIITFDGAENNEHSIELAALSGIELLEVEFTIHWGRPPRERSNRFRTVRAVMKSQLENTL